MTEAARAATLDSEDGLSAGHGSGDMSKAAVAPDPPVPSLEPHPLVLAVKERVARVVMMRTRLFLRHVDVSFSRNERRRVGAILGRARG